MYVVENKLTQWFVYEWEKPTRQKPHWVILRSPLLIIHYYQNKQLQVKESQYLIPTYSWTLISIPNWTCSIMTISHFQCTAPSTWLTNRCTDSSTQLNHQLEKNICCRILQQIFFSSWWLSCVLESVHLLVSHVLGAVHWKWEIVIIEQVQLGIEIRVQLYVGIRYWDSFTCNCLFW